MTLSDKQRIFSLLLSKLIRWAYDHNYEVVIGEVLRTEYQQREYVRTGKSKTLNSKHLSSCAVDLSLFVDGERVIDPNKNNFIIDGKYTFDPERFRPLGEYWETLGNDYGVETVWGGRFGVKREDYATRVGWDAGHFEIA